MSADVYIYQLSDLVETYEHYLDTSLTPDGETLNKNEVIDCAIRKYVCNKLIDEIDANRGNDPAHIINEYRDRYYKAYENATGKTIPLIFLELSQIAASIGI